MNKVFFFGLALLLVLGGFAQADEGCCSKQACPTGQKITKLLGEWKSVSAEQATACPVEQGKIQATFASVTEACPLGSRMPETLKFTQSVLTAAVALDGVAAPCCGKCKDGASTDSKCCGSDGCKMLSKRSAVARDLHRLVSYAVESTSACSKGSKPTSTGEGGCSKSQATSAGCTKTQATTAEGCSKGTQLATTGEGCSKSKATAADAGCSKSKAIAATAEGCSKGTQLATTGEGCSKGPECCQLQATTTAEGCSKSKATVASEGCSKGTQLATTGEGCSQSKATAAGEGCCQSAKAVATSSKAGFCAKTLTAQAKTLKASWEKVPDELATMCPNKKKELLASVESLQKTSRVMVLLPETMLAAVEGLEGLDRINNGIIEYAKQHPEFAERACEKTREKFLEQARLVHDAAEVLQQVRTAMKNMGPQEKPSVALGE